MDPAGDDDVGSDIDELRELARQLRGQLLRHAAHGAWAAPGGATARNEVAAAEEVIEAESEPVPMPMPMPMIEASAEPVVGAPPADVALDYHPQILDHGIPDEVKADARFPASPPRRTLPQIREELGECTRCKLHTTRRTIVYGVGAADTPLMFVGEAPGEQEDRRGEPFVGPAGQLLDKMIEAMGWTRDTVYIANTTKCRPPNNRNPQPDELAACMPFLHQQIESVAPRIIVALGRPASNQLLDIDAPISSLRGKFHDYRGAGLGIGPRIMPTFHPAYLLRDPDKKRLAWADLKLVMAELSRLGILAPSQQPKAE